MSPSTQKEVRLTSVQLNCLLRHARAQRDAVFRDMKALEERSQHGHDGHNAGAAMVLATDLQLLDEAIARLWIALNEA